jgi:hypothetical protein
MLKLTSLALLANIARMGNMARAKGARGIRFNMATYGGFPWMDQPPPSTDLHAGGELEQQIAPKRYDPGSYNSR